MNKQENKTNNLKKYTQLKCLFMTLDEFRKLVDEMTGGLWQVEHELDGIFFTHTDKAEETDTFWNVSITETLSSYFGVTVTSVHADAFVPIGIWIAYEDEA